MPSATMSSTGSQMVQRGLSLPLPIGRSRAWHGRRSGCRDEVGVEAGAGQQAEDELHEDRDQEDALGSPWISALPGQELLDLRDQGRARRHAGCRPSRRGVDGGNVTRSSPAIWESDIRGARGAVSPGAERAAASAVEAAGDEVGGDARSAAAAASRHSRMPRASTNVRRAAPRRASRRRRPGGSGRGGGRPRAPAPGCACAAARTGAIRPKKMPWIAAAIGAGRWSSVSSTMPAQNGTTPRGTARVTSRSAGDRQRERSATGTAAARRPGCPASSALSSTGISAIRPRTRSGASDGDLQRGVGPERGAADDRLLDAPSSSSRAMICSPKAVIE